LPIIGRCTFVRCRRSQQHTSRSPLAFRLTMNGLAGRDKVPADPLLPIYITSCSQYGQTLINHAWIRGGHRDLHRLILIAGSARPGPPGRPMWDLISASSMRSLVLAAIVLSRQPISPRSLCLEVEGRGRMSDEAVLGGTRGQNSSPKKERRARVRSLHAGPAAPTALDPCPSLKSRLDQGADEYAKWRRQSGFRQPPCLHLFVQSETTIPRGDQGIRRGCSCHGPPAIFLHDAEAATGRSRRSGQDGSYIMCRVLECHIPLFYDRQVEFLFLTVKSILLISSPGSSFRSHSR